MAGAQAVSRPSPLRAASPTPSPRAVPLNLGGRFYLLDYDGTEFEILSDP